MSNNRFLWCQSDHCCSVKKFDNSFIILLLYVDEMLIVGACIQEINKLKMELSKEFAMEDLRPTKRILGIRTTRDKMHSLLKLSQEEYLNKVLIRFNMDEAKL